MHVVDFEFNGKRASDFNCIVGSVDGGEEGSIPVATKLTLNTVKVHNTWCIASTEYSEVYTVTLGIVKTPCKDANGYLSETEVLNIMKWLRAPKNYKKFKAIYDDGTFSNIYLMGLFTEVNALKIGGKVVGFEMVLETNAAYGYLDEVTNETDLSSGQSYTIQDPGYEIGYTYPQVKVTCQQAGNLELRNSLMSKSVKINNCSTNEVLTFSGETKVITSSNQLHTKLYNDFNYVFPQIVCTDTSSANTFTSNLRCRLSITYSPIVHIATL